MVKYGLHLCSNVDRRVNLPLSTSLPITTTPTTRSIRPNLAALLRNSPTRDLDKPVQKLHASRDANRSPPQRILLSVSVRRKWTGVRLVPGAQLGDAAQHLDVVSPACLHAHVKGHPVEADRGCRLRDVGRQALGAAGGLALRKGGRCGDVRPLVGGRGAGRRDGRGRGEPAGGGGADPRAGGGRCEEGGVGPG